jgi:hypothetical protein
VYAEDDPVTLQSAQMKEAQTATSLCARGDGPAWSDPTWSGALLTTTSLCANGGGGGRFYVLVGVVVIVRICIEPACLDTTVNRRVDLLLLLGFVVDLACRDGAAVPKLREVDRRRRRKPYETASQPVSLSIRAQHVVRR